MGATIYFLFGKTLSMFIVAPLLLMGALPPYPRLLHSVGPCGGQLLSVTLGAYGPTGLPRGQAPMVTS